ncbi:5-hydroxytryptamine receptor 2B isoform X2 [Denticeps clupeoides]|uniref:5-hydroxytryptamine receptor 2B isoform X2 n=1 Tax=Denticeps clupeoides TaxID=299321 RepID=UPI0010A34997|nr:5-hydroxytryptamine receptor 2B isoform X2 [Denticeps clupeoides]
MSQQPLHWASLLILLVIIPTIGGNILVIMAVSLEKKLQNATNYFLMSLAVADLLVGLLVMPVAMINVLFSIAIPIPIKGLRILDHPNNITFNQNHTCLLKPDSFGEFIVFGSLSAFFIPLTVMMVIYLLTIQVLRKKAYMLRSKVTQRYSRPNICTVSQQEQHHSSPPEKTATLEAQKKDKQPSSPTNPITGEMIAMRRMSTAGKKSMQNLSNEQRASKVLGIVFLLFVVMWCPFFITNVTSVLCTTCSDIVSRLTGIFEWIGYVASGVNPLVYTLFNKTFRDAFARYITCNYSNISRPLKVQRRTLSRITFHSSVAENSKLFMKHGMKNGISPVTYQSPLRRRPEPIQSSTSVLLDSLLLADNEDCKPDENVSYV